MQLVVLTNDDHKEELLKQGTVVEIEFAWIKDFTEFANYKNADGFFDLEYENRQEEIEMLQTFSSKPVIVNSVAVKVPGTFVRINAWPGFLERGWIEAACSSEEIKKQTENFFSALQKKIEWLPDDPGFVSARVIAMIINEAYFTLEEGVSTKSEIDKAMKLGTNYPF